MVPTSSNAKRVDVFLKYSDVIPKTTVVILVMKQAVLTLPAVALNSIAAMDDAYRYRGSVTQKTIAVTVQTKGILVQRKRVPTTNSLVQRQVTVFHKTGSVMAMTIVSINKTNKTALLSPVNRINSSVRISNNASKKLTNVMAFPIVMMEAMSWDAVSVYY